MLRTRHADDQGLGGNRRAHVQVGVQAVIGDLDHLAADFVVAGARGRPEHLQALRTQRQGDLAADRLGGRFDAQGLAAGFDQVAGPAGAFDQVAHPDEVGNEAVARILVEVGGRAALADLAVLEHGHAVGHDQRFFLVVGHDDEGDAALVLQALEFQLHLPTQLLVQRAQRLVEQQHARTLDQRAGQRHPLTLAAGQLVRAARGEFLQVGGRQHGVHTLGDLVLGQALHLQAVGDVVAHVHGGEQRVRLEHQVQRPAVRRDRRDVPAIQVDAARGRRLESGEHSQERALAAAGGTEQGEELVLADGERHVVHGLTLAVALAHLVQGQQRGFVIAHSCFAPC
ncbi:hypothetical protein D9M70_341560 [compost metagenome]